MIINLLYERSLLILISITENDLIITVIIWFCRYCKNIQYTHSQAMAWDPVCLFTHGWDSIDILYLSWLYISATDLIASRASLCLWQHRIHNLALLQEQYSNSGIVPTTPIIGLLATAFTPVVSTQCLWFSLQSYFVMVTFIGSFMLCISCIFIYTYW